MKNVWFKRERSLGLRSSPPPTHRGIGKALLRAPRLVIAHGSLVYSYSAAGHSLGVALHSGSGGLCSRRIPKARGASGIIWVGDHLRSSRLGSSGIILDHLGSSGFIWDHLGLGSSESIWDHLAAKRPPQFHAIQAYSVKIIT